MGCPTVDTNNNIHGVQPGTGTGQVNLSGGKAPATIAAGDIATDAVSAAAVSAAAVTKVQTGLATPTNITAGTITTATSVTNDVGITQAAADKVWGSASRSLTTFGTLVADMATAVWAAVTRTITGGTIGTYTGNTPQTGDAFARLGAPVGLSISADIAADAANVSTILGRVTAAVATATNLAALKTELDGIAADYARRTGDYSTYAGADTAGTSTLLTRITAAVATAASLATLQAAVTGIATDYARRTGDYATVAMLTDVQTDVDEIQTTLGAAGAGLTAIPDSVTLTEIGADVDELITTLAAGASLTVAERNAIADALLDRTNGVDTGFSVRSALKIVLFLRNISTGSTGGAGNLHVRDAANSKDRLVKTVDVYGNTTAIVSEDYT